MSDPFEDWQRDHISAVNALLSEKKSPTGDRKRQLQRFFVDEQRVFNLESLSEAALVDFLLTMRKYFGKSSEIAKLEICTRLFRLTPKEFLKTVSLFHADDVVKPLLTAEAAARGVADFTSFELHLLRKWLGGPSLAEPVAVDEEELSAYAQCLETTELAELEAEAAMKELQRRDCPNADLAVRILRRANKEERKRFFTGWGNKMAEYKFESLSDALMALWVFTVDPSVFERQLKRLNFPADVGKDDHGAKAEAVELLKYVATSERLWKSVKPLMQWLVPAIHATDIELVPAILEFPNVPEVSVARLQRLVQSQGPIHGETLVRLAKSGAFNEDYWRKNTDFMATESHDLGSIIAVFYACCVTLSVTGDLAWVSHITPERFYVSGGFSEDQRLEHYETTFKVRDLAAQIAAKLANNLSPLSSQQRVRLLWALAVSRLRVPLVENSVGDNLPPSLNPSEEVEWSWASAMLRRSFVEVGNWKKLPDVDLLNYVFAMVAGGADAAALHEALEEVQRRAATLKVTQLQAAVRLLHWGRHLRHVEIANFSQAITDHNKRLLEKRDFARRPMWRQAMQASLATQGIFMGASAQVDVQASVAMVFPIDAVVKVKTGVIGIDVDRPLSFFRSLDARRLDADVYTLMMRELVSLYKLENSSITPLKLVNIRLDKWAAIPATDIPKQLEFLKGAIRHALNL